MIERPNRRVPPLAGTQRLLRRLAFSVEWGNRVFVEYRSPILAGPLPNRVEALAQIGPPAKDALPALTKALENAHDTAFTPPVEAKWRIDGDANSALQRLIPLLDDDEREPRSDGVLRALEHIMFRSRRDVG